MKQNSPHIYKWLLPVSWLYGCIVFFRRKFFDWGILEQKEYVIPVISVGNITVGGTGKTPHIEYIVRLLKDNFNVAILSRGYKRKTKGFVLSTEESTYQQIGDEPFQMKSKFPKVTIAVDGNRRRGIESLEVLDETLDVILLDDAYQHLHVKPSYSILLTDYNRPIYKDEILPAGRLREGSHNSDRANMIIVTKCPIDIRPIDMRIISHDLCLYPYQTLLFTTIEYGDLIPLYNQNQPNRGENEPLKIITGKKVLLLTGIASPETLLEEIKRYTCLIEVMNYPDHHNFNSSDIKKIEAKYNSLEDKNAITIVTEKDAVRLNNRDDLSDNLKRSLYYIPIEIGFIDEKEHQIFNKKITNHVRENSRNSKLHQK